MTSNYLADSEKAASAVSLSAKTTGAHVENVYETDQKSKRGDADEALAAFKGQEDIHVDDATSKRLLRRIDRRILPVMCLIYGMNFLDKTTLSYASVMGLAEDINLVGDQYQWLASLFYFGYLAWEWPTVRLLQRFPIAKYSGACILIWGTVLTLFSVCNGFTSMAVLRVLLGAFEAGVTPAWALITSQWYKTQEQGSRTAIWFSFNGISQLFGAPIAYGIAKSAQTQSFTIAPWKILFIFAGILTVCLGIIFLLIVPDSPLKARWLSEEDRILAVARVRTNQQGIGNRHFKKYQFLEALTDPLTWAFMFYSVTANIPNGGITNFFNQLIVSFGYSKTDALLLGMPGGAVQILTLLLCGWLGDKTRNRLMLALGGLGVAVIGTVLLCALPNEAKVGKLIGYYLTIAFIAGFVCLLSLISSNVAGYTKKTTVSALYLICYCAGNIIGPQTFRPQDAPRYIPAIITILVCFCVCMLDLVFIWWYLRRMNKKKEETRSQPGYVKLENSEWMDLTDRENPEFIYTL